MLTCISNCFRRRCPPQSAPVMAVDRYNDFSASLERHPEVFGSGFARNEASEDGGFYLQSIWKLSSFPFVLGMCHVEAEELSGAPSPSNFCGCLTDRGGHLRTDWEESRREPSSFVNDAASNFCCDSQLPVDSSVFASALQSPCTCFLSE